MLFSSKICSCCLQDTYMEIGGVNFKSQLPIVSCESICIKCLFQVWMTYKRYCGCIQIKHLEMAGIDFKAHNCLYLSSEMFQQYYINGKVMYLRT